MASRGTRTVAHEELHAHKVSILLTVRDLAEREKSTCANESRLFGQIVIVYCLRFIDDGALAVVLPDGYEQWTLAILELIKDCAPFSPSLYRDSLIAEIMCNRLQESSVKRCTPVPETRRDIP
jgi:hypothetical protein